MTFCKHIALSALAMMLTACGAGAKDDQAGATGAASAAAPRLLAGVTTVAQPASMTNARAMWSWYDSDVATTKAQNAMLDFALANKIGTIFLESEALIGKPALLSGFLDRAAGRGVQVELLFGAPDWVRPANQAVPLKLMQRVNSFVAGLKGARPAGVHFDIEPQALPDWQTDPVTLGNQLVDLYGRLMAAKGPGVSVNADIAMGYEAVTLTRGGVVKTLSQWMVDSTDRTTLMDYRDSSAGEDGIVAHAVNPVSYALLRGKRATVGVETTCNIAPAKITFCEEGMAGLNQQLSNVVAYFGNNGGFGGVAIHDYANFRKLAP